MSEETPQNSLQAATSPLAVPLFILMGFVNEVLLMLFGPISYFFSLFMPESMPAM